MSSDDNKVPAHRKALDGDNSHDKPTRAEHGNLKSSSSKALQHKRFRSRQALVTATFKASQVAAAAAANGPSAWPRPSKPLEYSELRALAGQHDGCAIEPSPEFPRVAFLWFVETNSLERSRINTQSEG